MYIICWNHDCRQTYDVKNFKAEDRNVKCEKCGDVLIAEDGDIQLSNNPHVIKTVDPKKLEESKEKFGSY